ncbi:MAG TPA: hemerythrin domain-containing protein [Herpetosiphonaceae bacterium]
MAPITQPLREEHQALFPHIEELRQVADMIGEVPLDKLRQHVDDVYTFLSQHLIPHAEAEDQALYPVVSAAMGAAQATATMSRDHIEVGRLTEELASIRSALAADEIGDAQAKALRRVLYGLYALVNVHFAKEEEIYLPLLDSRLTAEEARRMFADMEAAAATMKQRAVAG